MPLSSIRPVPVAATAWRIVMSLSLIFRSSSTTLVEKFGGELVTHPASHIVVRERDRVQQRLRLRGGGEPLGSSGNQLQQQPVQPVDGLGSSAGQFVASVREQPQRHQLIVDAHMDEVGRAQRDHRHRVGVSRVGLAAVAGVEDAHPSGQLGWHVHHGLAIGDQPLGHVSADAVAPLHRPPALLIPSGEAEHLPIPVRVGAVSTAV
jgi:hypothetical protein